MDVGLLGGGGSMSLEVKGGVDEAYEKAKQLLGQALDARGLL